MADQAAGKWDVKKLETTDKAWSERTGMEKVNFVALQVTKSLAAIGLLYMFILSLGLMGNAFKILGGPTAGKTFRNNEIFDNPFAGCSLGILATVLVQSSSTSTSIIITMTAAGLIVPENAIYMIMGANIGTSVTNTIVSMSHMGDRDEYRRAFGGATVHDCFNFCTVAILLPLEYCFHILYRIGDGIVSAAGLTNDDEKADKVDFIKKITKPITQRILSVDKNLITAVAEAEEGEELDALLEKSMIKNKHSTVSNLFMDTPMTDTAAGWLLLVVSLVLLSTTLILLVKLLQTIFRGRVAIKMQRLLNLEFKSVPFVADYILVLFGAGITVLMQSSSVTTSTLTPLVGIGLISLEKMFPFTVGANIGTTVTGILSALANSNVATAMTVAMAHLFFNLIGTAIWFPLPFMRAVPINMAKGLGSLAADWWWFPVAYTGFAFGVMPGLLLFLSLAHWAALFFIGLPIIVAIMVICVIFYLRATRPTKLPEFLRKNYNWMASSMLVVESLAETQDTGGRTGSTDIGSPRRWWFAPIAYGLGWYALLLLLSALPNAQWADMYYNPDIDQRDHIGMGSWSACSAMFSSDPAFAPPNYAAGSQDLADHLTACTADLQADCAGGAGSFSTAPGAFLTYGASHESCNMATTEQWEGKCFSLAGCGSGHDEQCTNVTSAVVRDYTIKYVDSNTALPWSAVPVESGKVGYCIPLTDLCKDVGGMKAAGDLSVAGTVFCALGVVLMLVYSFMGEDRDMGKVLVASSAAFALAWLLLLVSWATLASQLGKETTCYVQDNQNDGLIEAEGKLRDIADGGSYSYGCVICAWVLITLVLGVLVERMLWTRKNPFELEAEVIDPSTQQPDSIIHITC